MCDTHDSGGRTRAANNRDGGGENHRADACGNEGASMPASFVCRRRLRAARSRSLAGVSRARPKKDQPPSPQPAIHA
jgi:hypothetical protein